MSTAGKKAMNKKSKVIDKKALEKEARLKERFRNKSSHTSVRYMRRMKELSGAPEEMAPFWDTLDRIYTDMESAAVPAGTPLIGTYCVMAPQELIYAAGAQPVKLCSGSYTAFSIGDDLVPRDACPLVKAVEGFRRIGTMPVYRDCKMMVVPVTCDCKKKIAGMLAASEREVAVLHVPVSKEDDDIEQYVGELYSFMEKLEDVTENRITYSSLSESMRMTGRASYELSRFLSVKKQMPYLMRGTHIMAMMNAAAYMNAGVWADCVSDLNNALEKRARQGETFTKKQLPRVMITGSPVIFPNIKIPLLIEEMGGFVAADETCMGERGMSDPVVPVDDSFDGLVRSLAVRAIRPCSCPTFADNSQRIYRIRQMIRDYRIEGVVYHVLRGCLVYDFEYKKIEEELGKLGIPVIRLETDYNEEDIEQLRIRIEAFIEMIKLQKMPELSIEKIPVSGGRKENLG